MCHLCKRKFILTSVSELLLFLAALSVCLNTAGNMEIKVMLSLYKPGHALRAVGVLDSQSL